MSCERGLDAWIYANFYLPFVHSLGLVLLCVELFWRGNIQTRVRHALLVCLCVTLTPWILGLVLVVPLVMVGLESDSCGYMGDMTSVHRTRAEYMVSMVTPAVAAACAAVFVYLAKVNTVSEVHDPRVSQSDVTVVREVGQSAQTQPKYFGGEQNDQSTRNSSLTTVSEDVKMEQRALLLSGVSNLLLTIPFPLFVIGYRFNDVAEDLDILTDTVLNDLFLWMLPLRSVVTPIVWLCCDYKFNKIHNR